MSHDLQNLQVWKSTASDRNIERTIVEVYINNRGAKTIAYTNLGSNVKYKENEEKFCKWISTHKAELKVFDKNKFTLIKADALPILAKILGENELETETIYPKIVKVVSADTVVKTMPIETMQKAVSIDTQPPPIEPVPMSKIPEMVGIGTTVLPLPSKITSIPINKPLPKAQNFVGFKLHERTAVYIDGQNLYHSLKALNSYMDYKLLYNFFDTKTNLVRCYYYNSIQDNSEYTSAKPLFDWLEYNNYTVSIREGGKQNIDSDLIVDAMNHAFKSRIDHLVLISGDGDFVKMVKVIQDLGIKVTVISTIKNINEPVCATVLRRQCDYFIDLYDMKDAIRDITTM